jgi:hypothetical protein
MPYSRSAFVFALLSSTVLIGQSHASTGATLAPQTTLPITFTKSISADHSKPGDLITAKTTQIIKLADGREVQPGAIVLGHVISAKPFKYDKTPYAKQGESLLEVQFDSLSVPGEKLPLHVSLRAIADPLTSWDARKPMATDMDPLGTLTQVGGDQLTPSQSEIVSRDGDVVGYNKHGGAFAHLIANSGRDAQCDGSNTEQAVSIFSASACGMYGFGGTSLDLAGSVSEPSRMSLSSTHVSPKIWRNTTALLEVLPDSNSASVQQ